MKNVKKEEDDDEIVLNEFHTERMKAAKKAVQEMMKQPLTLEMVRE